MFEYDTKYLVTDRRIGDRLYISGKEAYETYNADLISFSVIPGEITRNFRELPGLSDFGLYGTTVNTKTAELQVYIGGPSDDHAQINVSNFRAACMSCVLTFEGSLFEYPAILTKIETTYTGVDSYHLVKCTFTVIRRKPLVKAMLTKTGVIYNEGNTPSGLRIDISSPKNTGVFEICGVRIVTLNAGKTLTIDGMAGKITEGGVSRFGDAYLIDFPKIKPGKNEIIMTGSALVNLSFYPVFL